MSTPKFADFFQEVYGYEPFPWQRRLAARVLEQGWPKLLDLPTGSGKTTAMDIALYALAMAPEKMPRRILLVVDRRIVVDQGAEVARKLLGKLQRGEGPACRELATRLRALWGGGAEEDPFAVAVMRGGMPRDNDWAKRPDQPVLGVSTIDQVGSRLFFRGYGVSPRSASIHAGLLGNDTLILLDEVHLASAFEETLRGVAKHYRKAAVELPARFAVVPMSATPGQRGDDVFALDGADRKHPVLRQRLAAAKLAKLQLVECKGEEAAKRKAVAEHAVREALRLQTDGAKIVGLVVNRVETARLAWEQLEQHGETTDRLLVTGRMRPLDRDHLVHCALLPRAGASRERGDADRPLVVVATQCIEAGADLDFDGLVTECASLDALRQRFGRLDRRGEVTKAGGSAASAILCRSDQAKDSAGDPIYGSALAATWRWMNEVSSEGAVDFGIDAITPRLPEGAALAELLAEAAAAPVLLPAHLDAWAQTSPILRASPEPDLALWLHGPQRAAAEVQVVWRSGLLDANGAPRALDEEMQEELARVRASSLEAMTLPLHVVRAWLLEENDAAARELADVLSEAEGEEDWKPNAAKDRAPGRPFLLRNRETTRWHRLARGSREEERRGTQLQVGDVVMVPTSYGGVSRSGSFDAKATAPVIDLADLAQLRGRGQPTLRMTPETLRCWQLSEELMASAPRAEEEDTAADLKARVREWAAQWPADPPSGFLGRKWEWQVLRHALLQLRRRPQATAAHELVVVEPKLRRLPRTAEGVEDAVTEDDDSSFRSQELSLRDHSSDVQRWAKDFAQRLGLPAALAEDLAIAGWLHDVGKADPRFQRWLVGGDEVRASLLEEPLAKSSLSPGNRQKRERARRQAGYPSGYRHELLSLAMIERSEAALAAAHDRELVCHLVASHHGWCRPFAPAIDDADEHIVRLQHGEAELTASARHRLARLGSGVAQRFWSLNERYGWWGLAWLEAVLRLADHRASAEREQQLDESGEVTAFAAEDLCEEQAS